MNKENLKAIKFNQIKEDYFKDEVCMGEFLATVPADGLTLEEAFELYSEAKKWADDDTIEVIVPYDG